MESSLDRGVVLVCESASILSDGWFGLCFFFDWLILLMRVKIGYNR